MPRLVVAPVGHQPAAVLCPLLEASLRPDRGDRVTLVCGRATLASAQVVAQSLGGRGISAVEVREIAGHRLPEALLSNLPPLAIQSSRVDLLINGGPTGWVFDLLELFPGVTTPQVNVWASRDQRLLRLDLCNGTESWSNVPDFGRDELLTALGLEYAAPHLATTNGTEALEGVTEIVERAGLLYAVLDAKSWDKGAYRRFILDHERLQRLALDPRRIALLGLQFPGHPQRTLQDGVVTFRRDYEAQDWIHAIRRDESASIAGSAKGLPSIAAPVGGSPPRWTGEPLLVAMGTQAGTTLQAIWAHQPRTLYAAYDPEVPASRRLASLLLSDKALRTDDVRLVPEQHGHAFRPEIEAGERLAVNLTPGDKISTLRMWLYGKRVGAQFWLLEGSQAVPANGGGSAPARPIPVGSWLRFNAPGQFETSKADDDQLYALASRVVPWLASAKANDLRNLGSLSRRGGRPLRLDEHAGTLRLPDGDAYDLKWLPPDVRGDFLDPRGGGLWFEWITASWLSRGCGLEEVACRVRVAWPGVPIARAFRDDLDIVSQHQGQWALWSCKTRGPRDPAILEREDLDEALAQANRVLGRHRLAILLVPRLAFGTPAWAREVRFRGARAWRAAARQWVVDCAFLHNTDAVRELAGRYALRP